MKTPTTFKEAIQNIMGNLENNSFAKVLTASSPEDAFDKFFELEFPVDKRAIFNENLVKTMGDYASTYFFAGAVSNFMMMGMLYDLLKDRGHKAEALPLALTTLESFVQVLDTKMKEFKVFESKLTATKALLRMMDGISHGQEPFFDPGACNCEKCRAKKATQDPASVLAEDMKAKKPEEEKTELVSEEEIKAAFKQLFGKDNVKIIKLKPEEVPEEVKKAIFDEFDQAVKDAQRKQAESN